MYSPNQSSSYSCGPSGSPLYSPTRRLDNPYVDFASKFVPRSFSDVIDWSEHVSSLSDDLGLGLRRLYTYFCTPLDIDAYAIGQKEHDSANSVRWDVLLNQKADYLGHTTQLGMNVGVYGNDFVTVTLKHKRLIQCPQCQTMVSVRDVARYPDMDFNFQNMKFTGNCINKKCSSTGRVRFDLVHQYDRAVDNIIIKHWPIRELDFDYLESTDELRVYWRIPNRISRKVLMDKDPDMLHDLDYGALEAVCEKKLLLFDDRVMFHAKEPHLSGLENRGLGIPRTLALARQHWLVQLLKKQCQALASSYVTPMKFFSMGAGAAGGLGAMDPVQQVDARQFRNNVEEMIRSHDHDPNRAYVLPYPVQFQFAGGGADQFVPVGLIQQAASDLSSSLVPMAMLKGELTAQAAPMFLRTFEAFNREIPSMYNRWLWFVVSRVAELLRVSPVGCVHQSAAIADNINVDSMLMQAASMGKTSDYVWMRRLNLNPQTERNRRLEEAKAELKFQEEMAKIQEQSGFAGGIAAQAGQPLAAAAAGPQAAGGDPNAQGGDPAAAGGDPAAGGAPPGAGGMPLLPSQGYEPPTDIVAMEAAAGQMAMQLAQLPQIQRDQELTILRQGRQAFHDMVTSGLERVRSDAEKQGRQQLLPQA